MSYRKESWLMGGFIVAVLSICIGLIAVLVVSSDPPAVHEAKVKALAEDELQKCRNRCVSLGAESFQWNGLYGVAGACACGGTLP